MGTRPEPDDVEARFRAIMDAEFGPAAQDGTPGPQSTGTDQPSVDGSVLGHGETRDGAAGPAGPQQVARPGAAPRTTGPTRGAARPPAEPFNLTEAMDRADPTPDGPQVDDFVQPRPTLGRPGPRSAAALVLFGLALATVVADLLGWNVPGIVGTLVICCFVASVVLVFTGLRREPRDPWDDGSRV